MSNESKTALVERKVMTDVVALAGKQITSAADYAQRLRELENQAFLLAPMSATSSFGHGIIGNLVVVVIDPSVDPQSGRGADVYHQAAIHKTRKVGDEWVPLEVSLNKNGLLKMLAGRGVNVYPTQRTDDGTRQYYWSCMAQGDVLEFDGMMRRLPSGSVEIDFRDGSAQIGGWTPEEWDRRAKAAEGKTDKWGKPAKPEAIGGWTADRVMQARKFGLRLAETKALNALARNLGIRQTYTIDELKAKPFVIVRPSFVPDVSDPEVRRMLTATALGARNLMYGNAPQQVALSHAPESQHGDPTGVIESTVVDQRTDAPPPDAVEASFDEPAPAGPTYTPTKVLQGDGGWYFISTAEGPTLATNDRAVGKALNEARKAGKAVGAETERVGIGGQSFLQVIELRAEIKL